MHVDFDTYVKMMLADLDGAFIGVGRAISDAFMPVVLSARFTERELVLLRNCLSYAEGEQGGLPGHNLMVLIGKLLNMAEIDDTLLVKASKEKDKFPVGVDEVNADDYKGAGWDW